MIISSKVTAQYKQVPLLDYLATRFKYMTREEWRERIENGRITHNGNACQPDTLVTQGDLIAYDMPDTSPPRQDYTVLYEDEHLLGVSKPPHLLVHASGPFIQENLIYQIRTWHKPPLPNAHLINRLDRETSGVILLAKDKETLKLMSQQFAETAVTKTYLALVHGQPNPSSGIISHSLIKLPKDDGPPRFAPSTAPEAKTAVTQYETLKPVGNGYALLRLAPKTGRTHQLRVHLDALGHPIVGDKVYGGENGRLPHITRHYLHCHSNQFAHPHTHQPISVTAPIPDDMQTFLADFGVHL